MRGILAHPYFTLAYCNTLEYKTTMSNKEHVFVIRLDSEEKKLLERISEHEDLARADVVRRAMRHYAVHLGMSVPKRRAKK